MDETEYQALKARLRHDFAHEPLIWGDPNRLILGEQVVINNATINLVSGNVTLGDFAFLGHNVSLLTGKHNIHSFDRRRQTDVPDQGRDIVIGQGAWLASNVTVIGPCKIGNHAVVCAASVVLDDVPDFAVVAGHPARVIRTIADPDDK
jgi:acetyltransferase-like isoleucine patch superfamily enzyme